MNWKRGLLRLWAVFSVLWILATVPLTLFYSQKTKEVTVWPTAAENAACEKGPMPDWCVFGRNEIVRTWHWPPTEFLLTIEGMPFGHFGIGAATYWVVRGFRQSP